MTWVAREVDPAACPSCNREEPGSRHWRAVNEPDRPHPGRAPAFHCSDCGRHIGRTRMHVLLPNGSVICARCWDRSGYEAGAMCSRAATAASPARRWTTSCLGGCL